MTPELTRTDYTSRIFGRIQSQLEERKIGSLNGGLSLQKKRRPYRDGARRTARMSLVVARVQRLPAGTRTHRDRILQLEGQDRLRLQDDLLSFRGARDASTRAGSGGRADRGAFASAKNAAEDSAHRRATADLGRSRFAARASVLRPVISGDGITLAVHHQPGELDHQIRLSGKAARGLHINYPAFNVGRGGDHRRVADHYGSRDVAMENVAD